MKQIKKEFGCQFAFLGTKENSLPAIVLELPSQNGDEDSLVILQEKGARQLAEALIREADKYKSFVDSQMDKDEVIQ